VHCTKAVHTFKSAPEDGRVCRPKHVEQIQIDNKKINTRKLLHLVGCSHRCSNDARSHKRKKIRHIRPQQFIG